MTHQPRRQFLKVAGAGALAAAALDMQASTAPKTPTPRTPWAYKGTDNTPGVPQFPLNSNNSLPALVVWLTMAVSEDLQLNPTDADLQKLADAVGLTKNSVLAIRQLMTKGTATVGGGAFDQTAQVYLQIGIAGGGGGVPYNPHACPILDDILSFAPAAIARDPQQ